MIVNQDVEHNALLKKECKIAQNAVLYLNSIIVRDHCSIIIIIYSIIWNVDNTFLNLSLFQFIFTYILKG